MSNDSNKEELNEVIKKGLQNFKEQADMSVPPGGPVHDAEGKPQALGTLDAPDNAAINMATIATPKGGAAPVEGGEKKEKKKEEEEEVKEDTKATEDYLSELLGENDLSESFKEKLATIFETALNDRISFVEEEMQKSFNESLNEQVETITEELSEKLDEFLGYVISEWTEENKLAIERGIKADIAESFMDGLKSLFENHYIDMPDEKVTVVEELLDAKTELEEQLNEQIEANIGLKREKDATTAKTIFIENCQGLTDTEIEKFYGLVEDVEFVDSDQFATKLSTIRESFFRTAAPSMETPEPKNMLTEDIQDTDHKAGADPMMEAYSKAISFQNRNKNG